MKSESLDQCDHGRVVIVGHKEWSGTSSHQVEEFNVVELIFRHSFTNLSVTYRLNLSL